jgi:hypothetical protein
LAGDTLSSAEEAAEKLHCAKLRVRAPFDYAQGRLSVVPLRAFILVVPSGFSREGSAVSSRRNDFRCL